MFREHLVGTAMGRAAIRIREAMNLIRSPRVALGTVVNDQMALPLLVSLCRSGDTFLDIGAHVGSVIADVQHRCPGATVIAVEAIPEKVSKLKRRFPSITVHSCALSDEVGTVDFYIDTQETGCSSLAERPHSKKISVPKSRLDDLVDKADLIKLDVEGAELGVLRGGERLVSVCRPIIMFESGPGNVLGYTKEDMFAWLSSQNYGIHAPNRLAGTGGAMGLEGFLDSHEYPRRTTNYFAIPHERFSEVRDRAAALLAV